MNKKDRLYDAKVRWQETRINQFSYVNYLVLTLSLAVLGFMVSLVLDTTRSIVAINWPEMLLPFLSAISLLISVGFGICCAYTRLVDFRITAKISNLKYRRHCRKMEPETQKIKEMRTITRKLGKRSWKVLRWQIYSFGAGILLLIVAIIIWPAICHIIEAIDRFQLELLSLAA